MRISIDGKWYLSGPPGGHRYVKNIVDSLLKIDRENEYTVYIKKGERVEGGGSVSFIPLSPPFSPARVFFRLPRSARRMGSDLLFTQTICPPARGIRKAVTVYDILTQVRPELFDVREIAYHKLAGFSLRWADRIFTISSYSKRCLVEILKVPPEKVSITYCAVDESFFEPADPSAARRAFNLPRDFLLYLGRINERKNLSRLIEAFHLSSPPELHLVLAGKKDWKVPDLEDLVRRTGLDGRVHFTGFVPDELLLPLLKASSGFVYVPLLEGFGIPPLEAMAAGIPVIVSGTSSLPEVVGNAGIVVDPEDTWDIVRGMHTLLNDSSFRQDLSRKGVERARSFRWEDSARTILETLYELAGRARS